MKLSMLKLGTDCLNGQHTYMDNKRTNSLSVITVLVHPTSQQRARPVEETLAKKSLVCLIKPGND